MNNPTTILLFLTLSIIVRGISLDNIINEGYYDVSITGKEHHSQFIYRGELAYIEHELYGWVEDVVLPVVYRFDMERAWMSVGERDMCLTYKAPDMTEVFRAVEEAVVMEGLVWREDVEAVCGGERYAGVFAGQSFVVCEGELGVRIVSPDFTMDLIGRKDAVKRVSTGLDCPASRYHGVYLEENTNIHSEKQWFRKKTVEKRDADKKVCVFLHGSGVRGNQGAAFEKKYWGDIRQVTKQCSDHIFVEEDSFTRPWYNETLLKSFCAACTKDQHDKYNIRNKIIFSHSMGNLIFAKALMDGYCEFDSSTKWYSSGAPLDGSRVAKVLDKICDTGSSLPAWVTSEFCDNGKPMPAYSSMVPGFPGLEEVRKVASNRTSGGMCGVSFKGLNSFYSIGLAAVQLIANLETPNDGLVATHSCIEKDPLYYTSYQHDFYLGKVNHADTTCRNGDTWFGATDQKPCAWYSART